MQAIPLAKRYSHLFVDLNHYEPPVGIEPTTSSLPRMRSNRLSYGGINKERIRGFEPLTKRWKRLMLPLHHIRIERFVFNQIRYHYFRRINTLTDPSERYRRIELLYSPWQGDTLPLC